MPNTLAEVVREKLHAGTLPREQPLKFWTSIGSGNPCTACDEPILSSQTEYEGQYYDGRPFLMSAATKYGKASGILAVRSRNCLS